MIDEAWSMYHDKLISFDDVVDVIKGRNTIEKLKGNMSNKVLGEIDASTIQNWKGHDFKDNVQLAESTDPVIVAPGSKKLKDSGQRQEFETGAVRDTSEGKGRYDLLQWNAIHRVAQTLEKGAKKYAARNWEKGIPVDRFLDSGARHLAAYICGARDEDHLAQAAWNILCAIETETWIAQGKLPRVLLSHHDKDDDNEKAVFDQLYGKNETVKLEDIQINVEHNFDKKIKELAEEIKKDGLQPIVVRPTHPVDYLTDDLRNPKNVKFCMLTKQQKKCFSYNTRLKGKEING